MKRVNHEKHQIHETRGFISHSTLHHFVSFVILVVKISSALLRTIPHFIPNLLPLFTPHKWPTAGYARFAGKIGFFHVLRHGFTRVQFETEGRFVKPTLPALSIPQPAATSMPRRWRKVQGMPDLRMIFWNSAPVSLAAPAKPLVGFSGMMFTWLSMPSNNATSLSAVSGESFFPAIKVHSKKIRLPVVSQ